MQSSNAEIKYCPYCGFHVNEAADECASCNRSLKSLSTDTAALEERLDKLESNQGMPLPRGIDYRSSWTVFGWPVLHVASGYEPNTRRKRVARGLIAIGDIAVGGIALGGVSMGGVAIGGCAVGLISFAGLSIGILLAIGGCAIGAGFSAGGAAIGSIAIGGFAIGQYAFGGFAQGSIMAYGGNLRDPNALQFFKSWPQQSAWLLSQLRPVVIACCFTPLFLVPFIRKQNRDTKAKPKTEPRGSFFGLLIVMLMGGAIGFILIWAIATLVTQFAA